MRFMRQQLALAILTITCCSAAFAGDSAPKPVIRVDTVSTVPGITVPADYLDALNRNLLLELGKTNHFNSVVTTGDSGNPAAVSLEMKANITEFKAGSRARRGVLMAAGTAGLVAREMGVGETRLVTHVALLESVSGNVIWEGDVKGAEKGAAFTASAKVANIEAKNIAKAVAKAMDQQARQK